MENINNVRLGYVPFRATSRILCGDEPTWVGCSGGIEFGRVVIACAWPWVVYLALSVYG